MTKDKRTRGSDSAVSRGRLRFRKAIDPARRKWQAVVTDAFRMRNKANVVLKHKEVSVLAFALLAVVLGFIAFQREGYSWVTSLTGTLRLFVFRLPEAGDVSVLMFLALVFAILAVFVGALLVFLSAWIEKRVLKATLSEPYRAVFGLKPASLGYLDTIDAIDARDVVIITADGADPRLTPYRDKGMAVLVGNALSDEVLDQLELASLTHALISFDVDAVNIELTKRLIGRYVREGQTREIRIATEIVNRELAALFHQESLLFPEAVGVTPNIDLKAFSFFEEAADDLFRRHTPDGTTRRFVDSSLPYANVLIGGTEMLKAIVYRLAQIGTLPNGNMQTIYVLGPQAHRQCAEIAKHIHYTAERFPALRLEPIEADLADSHYLALPVWTGPALANVILCHAREQENLDLAVELFNRVYIRATGRPSILFGIYGDLRLSEAINADEQVFSGFHTFGSTARTLSHAALFGDRHQLTARLIHFGYGDVYDPERLHTAESQPQIDARWHDRARYGDKLSNIAAAWHIDMKLKALGLRRVADTLAWQRAYEAERAASQEKPATRWRVRAERWLATGALPDNADAPPARIPDAEQRRLLAANRAQLDRVLADDWARRGFSHAFLVEASLELPKVWSNEPYTVRYWPTDHETLFERLIDAEHRRWNAFHLVNGWVAAERTDKPTRRHACLAPLSAFDDDARRMTLLYDVYATLYLPNYLASSGYRIEPWAGGAASTAPHGEGDVPGLDDRRRQVA